MDWTEILTHWLSPAGALIVIGAMVWGIQLNVAVMKLTTSFGRHQSIMDKHENETVNYNKQLQRISLILDHVEKRMEGFEIYQKEHTNECLTCKERLITIEEKIKNHSGK